MVGLMLAMVIFTLMEFNRMLLVTTAIADSTRAGMRYAVVHGSETGRAAATTDDVKTVIKNYASTGILDSSRLTITIAYSACDTDPGSGCSVSPYLSPGSKVDIRTVYPYDPFTTYFPLSVSLSSTSQGVITY